MSTEKEALCRLYTALNCPSKAGSVWVKYERPVIDSALVVLKQLIEAKGIKFVPLDSPAE